MGSFILRIIVLLFFTLSVNAQFTKTFLIRVGGAALNAGEETTLAKYDYVLCNRYHYNQIGGDTWGAIQAINPSCKIYLYMMGIEIADDQDGTSAVYLNKLGRWDVSRSHSMGSVNGDHSEFFLLDAASDRIVTSFGDWLLDFGLSDYRKYWVEAVKTDIVGQAWEADGIFVDGGVTILEGNGYLATPVKYNDTDSSWYENMNGFISTIVDSMGSVPLGINYGKLRYANSTKAYHALDDSTHVPEFALEELAFISYAGPVQYSVQFFGTTEWLRWLNALNTIQNYKNFYFTSSRLSPGESGTANTGQAVTFEDVFWFALASFQLGKNDNSYFSYLDYGSYSQEVWFDEYDHLDLGDTVTHYATEVVGGVTIYKRTFDSGWVYVNPSNSNAANIALPSPGKQLTRDNMEDPKSSIEVVNEISLLAHRGAFVYKDLTSPPTYPTVLTTSIVRSFPQSITTTCNVTDDGGAAVTAKGVCWATIINPTTADDKSESGTGEGSFSYVIPSLTKGQTYYVRSYATNATGTSYGANTQIYISFYSYINSGGKKVKYNGKYLIIR